MLTECRSVHVQMHLHSNCGIIVVDDEWSTGDAFEGKTPTECLRSYSVRGLVDPLPRDDRDVCLDIGV